MAARCSWSSISRTDQNAAVSAAAPPTLALNYSEVFGRLRGEGVPVLEVPLLDLGGEKEPSFDLGPVDYTEVFGGYDGCGFAPSYDEVFGKSVSEEEACWTQSSLEKSCSYTQSMERSGTDRVGCGNNCSKEIVFDTDARDVKPKDILSQNDSQSNGPFVKISGIDLRTHPSKCPPPLRQPPCFSIQNEDLYCSNGKSRGSRSKSYSFHGTESLVTFYDVEVDASSSAAASAAAMLDVMERAQAKLDSAKEIMERKKEGLLHSLKSCQKKSCKGGDIDMDLSIKWKQNLIQKVSEVESVGRRQQNVSIAAETVSRSREVKKGNSAVHKPGSLSCRDFENSVKVNGVSDAVDLLDMAKNDKGKRLVKPDRSGISSKIIENVRKCNGEKEVQCCEPSSEHKIAERQPLEGENKEKLDFETSNTQNKHLKIEAHSTEQIDQGLKSMSPKVVDIRVGLTEEACIGLQNSNTVLFACNPVEDIECLKEPYESNIEKSQAFFDWWGGKKVTVAREEGLEELQSYNDNTKLNGPFGKLCASEDHCMDVRAALVEPFRSSCELKENWIFEMGHLAPGHPEIDPDDRVVGSEVDLKTKLEFSGDKFELQSSEKIDSVSAPTFEEKNVVKDESIYEKIKPVIENEIRTLDLGDDDQNMGAATTGQQASQKILIHPRMLSKSDGLEEIATTELGKNEMLSNKAQMPAMSNDRRKLPKMVDLEVDHLQKSRPASENSFWKHSTSDKAVKDLMLVRDENSHQEQLKKLEKERVREREKDRLVVDIALHEVHEKVHNAKKTAVERGTTEHQQSIIGDSLKPEELYGESPQRCKARLERQRRMAQRAAMALAEKHARDLAAQRELTERNRFADSLGAEVKRWATGKEGNLRALLSTLQYILRADSGWKAIPLTEVITQVGVKKAYRKATLYVHPDKVQQRGANAQQKFICEKVFDLLKDAWNKFNSEGQ